MDNKRGKFADGTTGKVLNWDKKTGNVLNWDKKMGKVLNGDKQTGFTSNNWFTHFFTPQLLTCTSYTVYGCSSFRIMEPGCVEPVATVSPLTIRL